MAQVVFATESRDKMIASSLVVVVGFVMIYKIGRIMFVDGAQTNTVISLVLIFGLIGLESHWAADHSQNPTVLDQLWSLWEIAVTLFIYRYAVHHMRRCRCHRFHLSLYKQTHPCEASKRK